MDTNHQHAAETQRSHVAFAPVEADGITYRGLVWFVGVLAGSVLVIHLGMYLVFRVMNYQIRAEDPPRAPLAAAPGQLPPAPNLLYERSGTADQNEPGYLREFRAKEDAALNGYKVNKAAGTATLPIARAKELLLQRGFPSRPEGGAAAPAAASTPAAKK